MEKQSGDKVFDSILREEVPRLNHHLPKQRRRLVELLNEKTPEVTSLDGRRIVMEKDELQRFASNLTPDVIDRIELPIVAMRRSDLGTGAFSLLGGQAEAYAVASLLGNFQGSFEDYRRERREEVIYKPEISELIRKFHSLIVIGFGVSEGLVS